MASKKSIVLSGYYGFNNVGDEAVLTSIIQDLREAMPEAEITVLSNSPSETQALYQVEAISRWDMKAIAKVVKASDLVISGGGSLLQDVTSGKTIPYYLAVVKIAQFYKKPVVFYSQGVGPIDKGISKWLVKTVANKVDHIFVREEGSKTLLESIGVSKAPVTVTIDPVLGIKVKEETYNTVKQSLGTEKAVGIYLRTWKDDKKLVEDLVPTVEYLVALGYEVYAIPMYYKEDIEIAKTLAAQLKGKVHVVDRELSIDEVVAYTANFEFILGMRLHSLIMAHAVGVPMIGLSYDPKVQGFAKEVGLPCCIDIGAIDTKVLKQAIDQLTGHIDEEKLRIAQVNEAKKDKIKQPATFIKALLG